MYEEEKPPPVSYEYYTKIFNTRFNIAFGYLCFDICSACDKYQANAKVLQQKLSDSSLSGDEKHNIENQIKTAQVENEVHKHKAEVFYNRKPKARKNSMKNPLISDVLPILWDKFKDLQLLQQFCCADAAEYYNKLYRKSPSI
ncbi:hypothetical protein ANN_19157 [Periplaneta americana]|uniref:Uncharacterized protein n=1 Tax=Periplaneta americana TaxID=6978 RepID=A0ABQ8S934_PERAM|nr:hypothetical protein ANN_19157 [Periplaneta americana]